MTLTQRISTRPCYRALAVIAAVLLAHSGSLSHRVAEQPATSCQADPLTIPPTKHESKLAAYFRSKGSPAPERMAHAVSQTSVPRLMAAVAVVESNGKVNAVNRHSKARGAFQVKEKFHGRVRVHQGAEVVQALQSERILSDLIEEKGTLKKALNAYGGSTDGVYARVVLAELQEVPR